MITAPFVNATTAYENKYGTEAEREKRREAQAKARVKAMAERESLQRDEEKQLMEVIKASLEEVRHRRRRRRRVLTRLSVCSARGRACRCRRNVMPESCTVVLQAPRRAVEGARDSPRFGGRSAVEGVP